MENAIQAAVPAPIPFHIRILKSPPREFYGLCPGPHKPMRLGFEKPRAIAQK
jgi:hypothetical protein